MKTIILDPLDPDSILAALQALKKHLSEREKKIDEYVMRLAQCGEEAAQRAYGPLVSVKAHKAGGTWEILAEGEQVVFLEFGTGVKTQDHELSGPLPIEIIPGSWSEGPEGKHTWSQWLESGRRIGKDYPYNTEPRPGMWEAYKAIMENQDRIAHEVFDK